MWDLLAFLLIVLPVEPLPVEAPQPLWQALARVAGRLDLVGDVERWTPHFAAEVRWCRRARQDLAGAPPSSDALRLPAAALARDYLLVNAVYRDHLEGRQAFELRRRDEWAEALVETRRRALVWEAVATAADPAEWVVHRRRALRCLRELLGDGYHSGRLPPPVPLEWMQWVD